MLSPGPAGGVLEQKVGICILLQRAFDGLGNGGTKDIAVTPPGLVASDWTKIEPRSESETLVLSAMRAVVLHMGRNRIQAASVND